MLILMALDQSGNKRERRRTGQKIANIPKSMEKSPAKPEGGPGAM
jgi:hypothetical protein